MADTAPLDVPVEEEFRVGTMALAWDGDEQRMIVEAQALVELDAESDEDLAEAEERLLQDEENGPPMLRVRLTGRPGPGLRQARPGRRQRRPAAVPAVQPAARPGRTRMPAPERIPPRSVTARPDRGRSARQGRADGARRSPRGVQRGALLHGRVRGRAKRACVYKPVAGERPLWDFPDGTLAQREVAAYEVSEATGWGLVPPTVLRDGPYGEGMCQLWIEAPPASGGR